jgi:hypothetical protein
MPPEAARAERGVFPDGVADTILRRGEQPRIQLDDPGHEPRETLVYTLAPSTSQSVTMRMDLALAVAGEASPTTVQFPTIALTLALATSSRDAAGADALVEGTLREVRIEPRDERSRALAAPLERQLRALRGARLMYRMSPQGRARGLELTPATDAPTEAADLIARMKGSFESMVAPLPDAPIGLGARWTVTSRSGGHADLVQWTTYTLRARDGSRFTVDTEVTQIAAGRTVAGEALPPGTEATIASFDARGSATTTLDLRGLLPERGQGTIETSMTIRALGSLGETKTNVTIAFEPER